jgi:hypothetical protein
MVVDRVVAQLQRELGGIPARLFFLLSKTHGEIANEKRRGGGAQRSGPEYFSSVVHALASNFVFISK